MLEASTSNMCVNYSIHLLHIVIQTLLLKRDEQCQNEVVLIIHRLLALSESRMLPPIGVLICMNCNNNPPRVTPQATTSSPSVTNGHHNRSESDAHARFDDLVRGIIHRAPTLEPST